MHSFQPKKLFKSFKTAVKFDSIHFSLNVCKREMHLETFIIEFMHKIPTLYFRVKLQCSQIRLFMLSSNMKRKDVDENTPYMFVVGVKIFITDKFLSALWCLHL